MFAEIDSYVLVRGNNCDSSPFAALKDFPYYKNMDKQGLKEAGFKDGGITPLQKYAWKYMIERRNCIMIGTGNTNMEISSTKLAYLVPIVAEVLYDPTKIKPLLNGNGPMALIITSCWDTSGRKIDTILRNLKVEEDMFKFYIDYEDGITSRQKRERDLEFINMYANNALPKKHIDIAVCNPEGALRLINDGILGLDRLIYLVFDDAEILFKSKQTQVIEVLKVIGKFIKKIKRRPIPLQMIFCGKEWTSELEDAYHNSCNDPVLLIRNNLQILNYSKIQVQAHLMSNLEDKITNLIKLLREEKKYASTIIISLKNETCRMIKESLKDNKITGKYLDSKTSYAELKALKNTIEYELDDNILVICSVDIANLIKCTKIERIIHFDMVKCFAERYCMMEDHIRDISFERIRHNKGIISHAFISFDDENVDRMVESLNKINATIPDTLNDLAKKVKRAREEEKDFCLSLKEYGECLQNEKCGQRHFFSESELNETHIPQTGEIMFKIVTCHSPSRYTAVIQKHSFIHSNGKERLPWVSYIEKMESIRKDMEEFYDNEINRVLPDTYPRGLLVAFKDNDGIVRGKILAISDRSINGFAEAVKAFCIDTGKVYDRVDVLSVYQLPEKFATLPPLAFEIIFEGLAPAYGESDYRITQVTNTKIYTEARIALGKILLVADNTVWVNPIFELEKPQNKVGRNFRQKFIHEDRICMMNPNHIKNLYELCKEVVPNLPQFLKEESPDTHEWSDTNAVDVEENNIEPETNDIPNLEGLTMEEIEEIYDINLGSNGKTMVSLLNLDPLKELGDSLYELFQAQASQESVNEDKQPGLRRQFNTNSDGLVEQASSIEPDATFNFKSCQVEWSLTLEKVILKVLVPEIVKYDINFSDDKRVLSFITSDPPEFGFNLQLYGKVKVDDVEVSPYGRYTMIKLFKRVAAQWPRVTFTEKKYNWLKQDMDSFCASIPEENEEEALVTIEINDESDGDSNSDEEGDGIDDHRQIRW